MVACSWALALLNLVSIRNLAWLAKNEIAIRFWGLPWPALRLPSRHLRPSDAVSREGSEVRLLLPDGGSPLLVVPAGAGPLRLFPDGAPGHQPPLAVLLAADSAMATKGKLGEAPTAALLRCRASPGRPLTHHALARHPATLLTTPIRMGQQEPPPARALQSPRGSASRRPWMELGHRAVAWMRRRAALNVSLL